MWISDTKPNERIKMKIPIKFSGQENLESKRLVLETHITSIELQGDVEKFLSQLILMFLI